jgi:hypothetical protein
MESFGMESVKIVSNSIGTGMSGAWIESPTALMGKGLTKSSCAESLITLIISSKKKSRECLFASKAINPIFVTVRLRFW